MKKKYCVCEVCGKEFEGPLRGRPPLYCPKCRKSTLRLLWRIAQRKHRAFEHLNEVSLPGTWLSSDYMMKQVKKKEGYRIRAAKWLEDEERKIQWRRARSRKKLIEETEAEYKRLKKSHG